MPRTPKTLRVEDLRRSLGNDKVDELLRDIHGTRVVKRTALKVTRDQLDRTVALVNGTVTGNARRAWIGTVPVFRLYFAESAQRRRFFNEWAQRVRDTLEEHPVRRRRGRPRKEEAAE